VGAMSEKLAGPPPAPQATMPSGATMPPVPQPVPVTAPSTPNWNWMGYQNPTLDESWTPGPPPTTPPDHQEPDEDRLSLAIARQEVN